jgi:hypothetical protein
MDCHTALDHDIVTVELCLLLLFMVGRSFWGLFSLKIGVRYKRYYFGIFWYIISKNVKKMLFLKLFLKIDLKLFPTLQITLKDTQTSKLVPYSLTTIQNSHWYSYLMSLLVHLSHGSTCSASVQDCL